MRVLGVDPALRATGYALVEGRRLLHVETLRTKAPLGEALDEIYRATLRLIEEFSPELVALEEPIYFRNPKTALIMGSVRAAVLLAAVHRGVRAVEVNPTEVKVAAVGLGSARKEQVRYMVRQLFGYEGNLTEHEADAAAVAWAASLR